MTTKSVTGQNSHQVWNLRVNEIINAGNDEIPEISVP
jgi:hypothetical protein